MTTYQIDVNEGMNNGVSLLGAYIFIEQGIISKVEFGSEKPVTVDEVAFEIIDGTGKYVTPGLIDSHVHIASVAGEADLTKLMLMPKSVALLRIRYTLEAALARGFTTVRDCGGAEGFLKAEIHQGSLNGPRLITCGHAISQTGGHGDLRSGALPASAFDSCSCHFGQVGVVADGVPECYKAAREEFRRGADFIKIMGGGGVASPTDKISNKQFCDDEIKALVDVANSYHTYVTAHAYTAEAIQNCIKLGVKGIEHGNLLDERTAELMAELGCYLTPTLVTYKVMGSDQFSAFLGPENNLLGPLYGYQTQEFRIRGKVQSAQEILLSATVTPAEMNGLGDKLGQIKPGFIADLLMMKSNPLDDITILDEPESNILFVMKEGRIY
ncbi:hypothetical protein SCEPF1_0049004600 [Saccharomyces cerevisiae]|nr:hypothetical protein SCEPF1_0049004600 [Saccharomyces cerevisiae]